MCTTHYTLCMQTDFGVHFNDANPVYIFGILKKKLHKFALHSFNTPIKSDPDKVNKVICNTL